MRTRSNIVIVIAAIFATLMPGLATTASAKVKPEVGTKNPSVLVTSNEGTLVQTFRMYRDPARKLGMHPTATTEIRWSPRSGGLKSVIVKDNKPGRHHMTAQIGYSRDSARYQEYAGAGLPNSAGACVVWFGAVNDGGVTYKVNAYTAKNQFCELGATVRPTGAWRTIKPALAPAQLNPMRAIPAGSSAPDAAQFALAKGCTDGPQAGTKKLRDYVQKWWPTGTSMGIYNCRKTASGNPSEHGEGRAYDHGLDASSAADRATAHSLVTAFTKKDAAGNTAALARRFGVEQIIWDCKIWTSTRPTWRSYDRTGGNCAGWDKTNAHRDHVHIGQNWKGARSQTTAYTGFQIR